MVKCPTGTPSQIKVNLAHRPKASSLDVEVPESSGGETSGETETLVQESELSECESRADKRGLPTPRDDLIYLFINCFLDILLERWEGKPCFKPKFKSPVPDLEEYGEDLGPCEMSITSSTDEFLKDLYQKRSSNLSKEKQNDYTESNASEYLNEEEFESLEIQEGIRKHIPDEEVHFSFPNGVWYRGKVSRRLMDGDGHYFWNDGASFKGEFEAGFATGKGRLEFPDMSVYEGDVYKGFRHGQGMFCFPDSPVMYSGQWWLGKKHGHGLIVYNEPSEGHNYYNGEWQNGVKEGFGFRQYLSGARYVGYWSNGERHGKGAMFWTNNDIYRGEWKAGLMHGYGEYTWNAFANSSLAYPVANIYRGHWENGKRNGVGLLELKTGCFIETIWVNNVKEGYGAVICKNGAVVSSELLFVRDKPTVYPVGSSEQKEVGIGSATEVSSVKKKNPNEEPFTEYSSRTKLVKAIHIPINAPVHSLNLESHIKKFFKQRRDVLFQINEDAEMKKNLVSLTPEKNKKDDMDEENAGMTQTQRTQLNESLMMEENNLRNFIIFNSSALKVGYEYYAKLACEIRPTYKCTLLRLFLWQMLLDGKIPNANLSLIDIDDIIANEECLLIHDSHSPFEQIQFWQFIQILILLSWHLYGQYAFGELPLAENKRILDFLKRFNNCEVNNVLKMALQHFIENDLFWEKFLEGADPPPKQRGFEDNDFAPMEAMYQIYCDVGKPHSVRDFIVAICNTEPEDADTLPLVRYFEKLPMWKTEGKNAITIGGELQHIPEHEPFNFPKLFQLEENRRKKYPSYELVFFKDLGPKNVMNCLIQVCPGIVREDCIVNADYQLTFLEFYKAVVLCAKCYLKMKITNEVRAKLMAEYKLQMEEYKRQMMEYEKTRESSVVSGKKSKQAGEKEKKREEKEKKREEKEKKGKKKKKGEENN